MEYVIQEGGSGSGVGYWRRWSLCPRKAWLSEQADENTSVEEKPVPNDRALVGTLVHAYLELWREGVINDPEEVEFTARFDIKEEVLAEAMRLAKWYFANCTRDGLGRVVATEFRFENPETIKITPFTGLIDLLVEVQDVVEFNKVNDCTLIQPGYYIVDYKTTSAFGQNDTMRWSLDPQPTAYMMALKAKYQLEGMLIEQIGTTKTPKRRVLQLPMPNEAEERGLNNYLTSCHNAKMLAYDHAYRPANWTQCLDYARTCWWYGKGCDRT